MKFNRLVLFVLFILPCSGAQAAVTIPLTVNLSETVTVTGTPRIAVDVGGTTRYATYTSGTGSNALTFTLSPQAGDVDLNGVAVSSPIDLNGGTITDLKGNPLSSLTFTPPSTTNVKVNYPSLGMDFVYDADGRYTLNGTAYNDLTSFLSAAGGSFTRASIGTYYNSAGTLQTAAAGVPRFDYDPVTHVAKGILIEESRTNLATYSTRMDNSAWFFGGTKTTGGTAPDGSTDATYYSGPSAATTASRLIAGAATATTMSYSVYAKYVSGGTSRTFLLRNTTTATNFNSCSFNLSTGTVTSGCTGWTITSVGNGWYRLAYTQSTGITTGDGLGIYFGNTGAALVASDSWLVWGAQLEAGAFATSFIPTTATTVTRANETLSIPTSGWFSLPESTLYLQAEAFGVESFGRFGAGFGSSSSDYFAFPYISTTGVPTALYYRSAGAGPVLNGNPVLSFNTLYKTAGSYSLSNNTASYSKNGTLSATGSGLSAMASATTLYVGTAPFNSSSATSGHYQKLKYYPAHVTDAQLQLLTQ